MQIYKYPNEYSFYQQLQQDNTQQKIQQSPLQHAVNILPQNAQNTLNQVCSCTFSYNSLLTTVGSKFE